MKPTHNLTLTFLCLGISLVLGLNLNAQVGINTTSPTAGTILDIDGGSNKGFLMTKVALTGTDDITTITPAPATGIMLYNTSTTGALGVQVTPGFYYWDGASWKRFYNQGYTLNYTQTAEVLGGSASTYVTLPGLDTGNITVPFTGIYQFRVEAYLAAGSLVSTAGDGATQGSISLAMDTGATGTFTTVKETYITSSSKRVRVGGSTVSVENLAGSAVIVFNIHLTAGVTYRFATQGRDWYPTNVAIGTFGKDTSGYAGSGGVNDAQRGSMSIALIRQM